MDAFIHQLLAGLATGGIYATVALALVMSLALAVPLWPCACGAESED